jgi:hypothetical protein
MADPECKPVRQNRCANIEYMSRTNARLTPGRGQVGSMNGNEQSGTPVEAEDSSLSLMAMKKFRQPMIEYLLSGLEDNDRWVRIMAAEMLGLVGDSNSAVHLKPLLATRDKDLRIVAAKSLAMIRAPQLAFSLNRADNCGNCMIRLVADEALERLKDGDGVARHL